MNAPLRPTITPADAGPLLDGRGVVHDEVVAVALGAADVADVHPAERAAAHGAEHPGQQPLLLPQLAFSLELLGGERLLVEGQAEGVRPPAAR